MGCYSLISKRTGSWVFHVSDNCTIALLFMTAFSVALMYVLLIGAIQVSSLSPVFTFVPLCHTWTEEAISVCIVSGPLLCFCFVTSVIFKMQTKIWWQIRRLRDAHEMCMLVYAHLFGGWSLSSTAHQEQPM